MPRNTQFLHKSGTIVPRFRVPVATSPSGGRRKDKDDCLAKTDALATVVNWTTTAQGERGGSLSIQREDTRTDHFDLGSKTNNIEVAVTESGICSAVVLGEVGEPNAKAWQERVFARR